MPDRASRHNSNNIIEIMRIMFSNIIKTSINIGRTMNGKRLEDVDLNSRGLLSPRFYDGIHIYGVWKTRIGNVICQVIQASLALLMFTFYSFMVSSWSSSRVPLKMLQSTKPLMPSMRPQSVCCQNFHSPLYFSSVT